MCQEIYDLLHEDVYLNGCFNNSDVIKTLAGRRDVYGRRRQADALAIESMAESFAYRITSCDAHVAGGIALGLYLSVPNYGEVGYRFMRDKITCPRAGGLGLALMRVVLNSITTARVERIFKSVEILLEGNPPVTEEEKAALAAYRIKIAANKRPKNAGLYAATLASSLMKEIKQQGTVVTFDFPSTDEACPVGESDERVREILEANYAYYTAHFDEIRAVYADAWQGYAKEEILTYYVVSLDEYTLAKNEQRYKEPRPQ